MPRLVHLPLALEGANKVHLISKIYHIIYETLSTRLVHQWCRKPVVHQESSNSCILPVSFISFSISPRQPSRTQPATSTLEKVGEAWREYQALFLCPKKNWCFPTVLYRSQLFSDSTNRQRSSLPKKISPVNQCIMDVEQISWAAIPDNQEQIIRYAALHRINVVYEYALLLIQACTRLLLFATSAGDCLIRLNDP